MRNLRTLLWILAPTCVLIPAVHAQLAQVTALSPSLSQAVDGVTTDTSGLGVVRITHGGVSGFMFMELPQQISVVPCPSGGGSCLAPSTITVRHTISGLRQVSIIVNGFCVGPVSGFGFVANESFTCPLSDARLDQLDQIFVRAQVTLQRAVGDPAPLLNLFFKWQVTRECPAADAPAPGMNRSAACELPDLAIDHVQVTQAIQTPANSVKLIRGKRAIVRVLLRSVGPGSKTLTGINGRLLVDGKTIAPYGRERVSVQSGPVDLADRRGGGDLLPHLTYQSLDFLLEEADMDTALLTVEPKVWLEDSTGKLLTEVTQDNNTLPSPLSVRTEAPGPLGPSVVGYANVCVRRAGQTLCPPAVDIHLDPWLPQVRTRIVNVPLPVLTFDDEAFGTTDFAAVATAVMIKQYLRAQALSNTFGYFAFPEPDQVVFVVGGRGPEGDDFYGIPGGLGSFWYIRTGCQETYTGEAAALYCGHRASSDIAHGIGHNYGLDHYHDSSPLPEPVEQVAWNPLARYSSRIPEWEYMNGFGFGSLAVANSAMKVTPWRPHYSAGEYEALRLAFSSAPATLSPVRSAGESVEAAVFSGWITRDGGTGFLDPAFHAPSSAGLRRSEPSADTCLRFFAGPDHCFPAKFATGAGKAYFAVAVALPAGTTRVALVHKGRELAELRTGTPPAVSFLAPASGETWDGLRKIRWSATGAQLLFRLEYSPDQGVSWLPLAEDLTTFEYDLNTADIIGGDDIRFRVTASSGLDNASAVSPPVRIPNSAQLALSSNTVEFRNTVAGDSDTQQLVLRNSGRGQLVLRLTQPVNAAFTIDSQTTVVIPANGDARLSLRFAPTTGGAQQSTLLVGGQTVTLRATGFALPAPNLEAPRSIDLGQVQTGVTKTTLATIQNSGTAPLIVTALSISGAGFALVDAALPQSIPSGGALYVAVRIIGGGAGTLNGGLTIVSNDPAKGQVQVPLTASVVIGSLPAAIASAVLNAASFVGGGVAPGEIITLFGSNVGPAELATLQLSGGLVSTQIGDTRIFFDGVPAPIIYALSGQTSVVVPYSIANLAITAMVIEYQGRRSDPILLNVLPAAPGLFAANSTGSGPGAIIHPDGALVTTQNPVARSGIAILFGTGEGSTLPSVADGSVTPGIVRPILPVSVTIGGIPQKVHYAGAAPGLIAGVLQINIEIAPGTPSGTQNVIVTVGGASSPPGLTIAIAGSGGTPQPAINVTPTSLDFGNVVVNQTRDLNLTVRNTGTATLTVSFITTANPRFTVVGPNPPINIGAGASPTLTVRFAPTAAGAQSGTLVLSSNDPSSPSVSVSVLGTGTAAQAPVIVLDPASLDFGTVTTGQTKDLNVVVRNTGNATLTVSSVTSSNARFGLAILGAPFNVGAGSFQNATIRFSPLAAGAQAGTITFNSNDPANPVRLLNVSGTGSGGAQAPVIVLDPTSLDFGTVTTGQTKDLNVVVRNTGNATLTVNSVTSSNPRFALAILGTPFNVGPGSFQNAPIRFSPNAAGLQTGTITFNSNDPASPARALSVAGMGSGGGGGETIACPPTGTNLIGNGSFEQPGNAGSFRELNPGDVLNCWTIAAGNIDYIGTLWTASDGSHSLDMDGRTAGTITQTFATTPGSSYTVAFDLAGHPAGAPIKQLEVSAAGQSATRTFDITGRSAANMGWGRQTFTFAANAATTTLRFTSLTVGGSIAGPALDNVCVAAGTQPCGTGGGGGGAETPLTITSAAGFPNGRISNQLPPLAIDGSTSTFTWTTESFSNANPSYLAVSLGASASVSRLRIFKDNDAGGPGLIAKNLTIEYTTSDPSVPLASRVWQTVSGLANGYQGAELLTATAVNANGTVSADNHNSLANGWASLTFTPVNATGIRIGFSNVTPLCCNHYRVYELQLYGPGTNGGGGGGLPPGQIAIAPNTTAAGTLTTSSVASTGCPACFANVYRLTVDTAQFMVIRLNSTAFDAYLQLLDLNGNILAFDDDGNGGTNARISGTFQPGTYLIEVTTALQGQTGAYVLALNPN